jgi:dTDP-4-dehydrorhamnose 3,5-epimerase
VSNRFTISRTPLDGLTLLVRKPMGDDRGFLERLFCTSDLSEVLSGRSIEQVNRTFTAKRGAVRGLHFQNAPHAETKFVTCLRGRVFDVAVDLRRGSRTFLQWHSEVLAEDDHRTLVIPEGFAHGFQTLTETCELLYFHTAAYQPSAESGVNIRDPRLGIQWPETITEISARDSSLPMLTPEYDGLVL